MFANATAGLGVDRRCLEGAARSCLAQEAKATTRALTRDSPPALKASIRRLRRDGSQPVVIAHGTSPRHLQAKHLSGRRHLERASDIKDEGGEDESLSSDDECIMTITCQRRRAEERKRAAKRQRLQSDLDSTGTGSGEKLLERLQVLLASRQTRDAELKGLEQDNGDANLQMQSAPIMDGALVSRLSRPFSLGLDLSSGEKLFVAWIESEGLRIRQKDLVRPALGITKHWPVLVAPSEDDQVDKVVAQDSADLYMDVKEISKEIKVEDLLLYGLTRHSGASWAVLRKRMSPASAVKRGRWRTTNGVQRYEKSGRVAQEWDSYTSTQKTYFLTCGKAVRGAMLGTEQAPRLPW